MNWYDVSQKFMIYINLAIIWGVLGLLVQWCVNQWLQYFYQEEISFWQALSALVLFCLVGWLIKYVKDL